VGTVSLAVLTFVTLLYTIIATTLERRQAATDRTTAEEHLKAEREAGEQRIRDERAHADEVRRRERQATRVVALISYIADLQPFMNVLPAASSHIRISGRFPDHLQEMGERELITAIRSLRRGAWAEASLLGTSDAAKAAADRYYQLVRLVYKAIGTVTTPSRDVNTLLNYSRWVRISLRMLAENETVPPIYGGSPELPILGLPDHMPAWLPHPLPPTWEEEAVVDAPTRLAAGLISEGGPEKVGD
jgi:hypothetical protein